MAKEKGLRDEVSSETGHPITHALVYGYSGTHGGWAQVGLVREGWELSVHLKQLLRDSGGYPYQTE